ncbi:OmpA family protein [Taibaiella sp. KBW10]|uniref:OmpA family protein n=1 Tax=Taibaiella sp. KBW10 TaxID=2153357 RepID=UPI001315815C|nr:OmpA family protein [Taibaiella sp. KBW10]
MKKYLFLLLALSTLFAVSATTTSCKAKKKTTTAKQRSDMKAAYESLSKSLPEAKVTYEDDKVKIVLPEALMFEVNSAIVNDSYLPSLAKIAVVLNRYPKTSVLVTGYTDISGSLQMNEKLSWDRAESAKAALLQNEVKNKRVYTWGFGPKNPIATNETFEGRQQNRRVEFVILYNYQDQKAQK